MTHVARISTATLTAAAIAAATFILPQPAFAQQAAQIGLEEIVVTARKREESLLEVPIAISAFSADAIEAYNFRDFTDLQYAAPGFRYVETGIRQDRASVNYVFRGLNVGGNQASAAALLFIDGAPVIFGNVASFEDAERVEVLKGPQTAYFGRNTFSGAINVVTRTPGNEWAGKFSGEFAQYDTAAVSMSVEGPLIADKLAFRVSGSKDNKGGDYRDNVKGGEIGGRNTQTFSATLAFTPSDDLKFKAYARRAELDDTISSIYYYRLTTHNCRPGGGTRPTFICGRVPSAKVADGDVGVPGILDQIFIDRAIKPFSLYEDLLVDHPGMKQISEAFHLIGDYEFSNGMQLSGNAAFHDTRHQIIHESTHRNIPFVTCTYANCPRPFAQSVFLVESAGEDASYEARLSSDQDSRLRWTVGGNHVRSDLRPSVIAGELVTAPPPTSVNNGGLIRVRTYAVFGGAYFDITEQFTASAEFRYQSDKVRSHPYDLAIANLTTNTARILQDTFKAKAPRITLEYEVTDDATVYANWARGFRPGTFNAGILTLPDAARAFVNSLGAQVAVRQERLDQYELGLKGRFLDGRLQTTVAGYYGKVTDQQINSSFFVNIPATPTTPAFVNTVAFLTNTGKTKIQGLEVEASAALIDNLVIDATFAWTDTEILQDFCAQCITLVNDATASIGKHFNDVPQYAGSLAGTYTYPLADELNLRLRAEYYFTGRRYAEKLNLAYTPAGHKVNLRAGVVRGPLTAEAYLTNAFDDRTPNNTSFQTEFNSLLPTVSIGLADKRRWGLRGTYSF